MPILVVDDDPMLLRSVQDVLEADRHAVVAAVGGQAGIDAFNAAHARGEPFAVVLTDMGMPYVDGRKVASAIKHTSAHTPVILITGWLQRLIGDGAPGTSTMCSASAEAAGTAPGADTSGERRNASCELADLIAASSA